MNATRKGLAALGCAALIAGATAACDGVKQVSTEVKVQDAFTKLEAGKAVTARLSFGASADQLYAALKHESGFQRGDATMLAALRVAVSASDGGKPLSAAKPTDKGIADSVRVSADGGASQIVEFRTVGPKSYIRVDLKAIGSLSGVTAADRAQIDGIVKASGKLPASYASVKALLKGGWVSIDPQAFQQFTQTLGKAGGAGLPATPAPKLDAKTEAQLTAAFRQAMEDNATFRDAGTTGGVDHVTVTVKAGKAAKELAKSLKPLAKQLGGPPLADLDKVPAKNVTVGLDITDGTVSGVSFDLAQLDKHATGKLPLDIALSDAAAPVSAPAGAVTLNPQDIMGAMMSLVGNGAFGPQGGGLTPPPATKL